MDGFGLKRSANDFIDLYADEFRFGSCVLFFHGLKEIRTAFYLLYKGASPLRPLRK